MNLFAYGLLGPSGEYQKEIEPYVEASCEAFFEGRLFVTSDNRPIVVEQGEGYPVKGLLLMMSDSPLVLRRIDELLQPLNPFSLYRRVERRIETDRGDELAWVYLCKQEKLDVVVLEAVEVTGGDWEVWRSRE